ncbi:MAG: transglutaminase-like domain-containing protein [Chloroflexi bacterium]|nr:transglutaminase-like domain-containing protein [Chloroflexota bacterium]
MQTSARDLYRQQSRFTDPGKYARDFDRLPAHPSRLAAIVQGLIIPPYVGILQLHNTAYADIVDAAFGYRYVDTLLDEVMRLQSAPLHEARPPRLRLGVNCRNFAVLLVSLLRHQGLPARVRIGFERYLDGPIHFEHRIAEYWDEKQGRWLLADAYVDPTLHASLQRQFDPLDLTPADFSCAGAVWLAARRGAIDAERYGDSPADKGLAPIRYALLHDFDALNGFEVCGNDAWGALIEKPQEQLDDCDWRFLDRVAELCVDVDSAFARLRRLHAQSAYGKQVRKQAAALGLLN